MAADDLTSIPGLEEKHRRALARQQITTIGALVSSDQRVIYRATANIRPRPTLEQIAQWQDAARSKLSEVATDVTDWHTAASFAVVFAQRQVGDVWEHRLEIERTEVEPERDPEVWPGWDCTPICGWMLGQLDSAEAQSVARRIHDTGKRAAEEPAAEEPAAEEPAAEEPAPEEPAAKEPAGEEQPPTEPGAAEPEATVRRAKRPQLRIESATISDATRTLPVVTAGALTADFPAELLAPVRVAMTVAGAPRGTQVQAVARFVGRGRRGWNAHDPVAVPPSGHVEFDLSGAPAGRHEVDLLAWAPDGTVNFASVRLPALTVGSGTS